MVDLVSVLDATVGEDPADGQTAGANEHVPQTYREFLQADALNGARLGVLTDYLLAGSPYGEVSKIIREAIATMADNGAKIVELRIDGLDDLLRNSGLIDYEFTNDVEAYLRASDAPVSSIAELLETGNYHAALETRYRRSIARAENTEEHGARLARQAQLRRLLIDTMETNNLDALIYPTLRVKPVFIGEPQYGSLCRIAAHSGLPAMSAPAGFTPDGLPVGIELLARPFDDGRLISLAYAWEQAEEPRRVPQRTPSLVSDTLVYEFAIETAEFRGQLRLDRPTQVLHYTLEPEGLASEEIIDVKLHRGPSGPVVALLGKKMKSAFAVPNVDLRDLLEEDLHVVIYTASHGELRGPIKRR